jgi:hypothetical protein
MQRFMDARGTQGMRFRGLNLVYCCHKLFDQGRVPFVACHCDCEHRAINENYLEFKGE